MTVKTLLSTLLFNEADRSWISPLLFICAVGAIEAGLNVFGKEDELPQLYHSILEADTVQRQDYKVVIYGESVTYGAILESRLEQQISIDQITIENRSIPSSSVPYSYFLLREQERKSDLPDAIILGYLARSYTVNHDFKFLSRGALWQDFKTAPSKGVNLETLLAGIAGKTCYTFRYREELSLLALDGNQKFLSFRDLDTDWAQYREEWYVGRMESEAANRGMDRIMLDDLHESFLAPFHPPRFVHECLRGLLKISDEHDIPVYVVVPPVPEVLQEYQQKMRFADDWVAYWNPLRQEFPNIRMIDESMEAYPDQLFQDTSHLNVVGGIRYTDELASRLREPLLGVVLNKQNEIIHREGSSN